MIQLKFTKLNNFIYYYIYIINKINNFNKINLLNIYKIFIYNHKSIFKILQTLTKQTLTKLTT